MKKNEIAIYELPLFFPVLAFSCGIILGFTQKQTFPDLLTFLFAYFFSLVVLQNYKRFRIFLWIGFFLAGILYGKLPYSFESNHLKQLPPSTKGLVFGHVTSLVESKVNGKKKTLSFTLSTEKIKTGRTAKQVTGLTQVTLINSKQKPAPGDYVRIYGTLETPKLPRSPGQFNYQRYLEQNGITKSMIGIGYKSIRIFSDQHQKDFGSFIQQLRTKIKDQIDRLFPEPENALVSALIIGIRKNIPTEIRDNFIKTGTAHLLAISGLNITLVAGSLYLGLRFLNFFPRKANAAIVLLTTIFYTFLAGANPPVVRAGIMSSVFLLGILIEQEGNFLNSLLVAFFLIILFDPTSLLTPSFQLSFAAVLLLILAGTPLADHALTLSQPTESRPAGRISKLIQSIRFFFIENITASLVTFFGLLLIIAHYFNIVSPVSFLANAIVTPIFLCAHVFILLLLPMSYASLAVAKWLTMVPSGCFKLTHLFLSQLVQIPNSYFYIPTPSALQIALYYLGFILLLIPRWKRLSRSLGILAVVASLIWISSEHLTKKQFELTLVDSKKQPSIYLELPDKRNYLILPKLTRTSQEEMYWTLKPFLASKGISTIDQIWTPFLTEKEKKILQPLCQNFKIQQMSSLNHWDKKWKTSAVRLEALWLRSAQKKQSAPQCVGLKIRHERLNLLFLFRSDSKTLDWLSKHNSLKSDVLYLPTLKQDISKTEIRFLRHVSASYIIHNQKKNLEIIENKLKEETHAAIFSMQRSGTIAFRSIGSELKPIPFLNLPHERAVSQLPD